MADADVSEEKLCRERVGHESRAAALLHSNGEQADSIENLENIS
jgi:hypothetical protein